MTPSIEAQDLVVRYPVIGRFTLAGVTAGKQRNATVRTAGRRMFVQALDGVSFAISAGDRVGLVGRNGSGKTTILKTIYGIYKPTDGLLRVAGKVDALFNIRLGFRPEATGRRNIVLRGLINGWTRREIDSRMERIIDFSELGDFIDLPFKSYSEGMAARLAFSIATSFEPEILLMDEWIGAGDQSFQEKARKRMDEMLGNAGIVILASHNTNLIRRTCNKVMELEAGKIVALKDADEWLHDRQNR